jgi:hypothetical protein
MAELREGVSVVTVGRTAPIPPGPQLAEKSLPVVIASDQEAVPVVVQNQQISEVSLSLLGIPRSETALGIFADVTTYDINPNEWQSEGGGTLSHIASESAAKITVGTAVTNDYEILSSKRFFRYQPGRVSAATFGTRVNTTTDYTDIKKFGAFDKRDGYYVEVQGGGQTAITDKETNCYCVRRTSALESNEPGIRTANPNDPGDTGTAGVDLVIVRAGLTYIHAGLFDLSLRGAGSTIGGNFTSAGGTTAPVPLQFTVPNDYRYTYEYRVPRKFFSHDRLDGENRTQYYSDRTPGRSSFTVSIGGTAGSPTVSYGNSTALTTEEGDIVTRQSVWDADFSKVTMFKVEYSWYGAVGGHFLAYVPDATTAGEARWVRMHHIRASNQLTSPSLANPTLPISYLVQKGSSGNENSLYKYGASYYIDGGDKGTIVARSQSNIADRSVTASGTMLLALRTKNTINSVRNRMQVYPTRLGLGSDGRGIVKLIKNPTSTSGTATFTSADTLSPIEFTTSSGVTVITSGITVATFFVGAGGVDLDLSPYFGYNKDYLSYPLTASTGDTLYLFAQSASGTINMSGALTWEEQV